MNNKITKNGYLILLFYVDLWSSKHKNNPSSFIFQQYKFKNVKENLRTRDNAYMVRISNHSSSKCK